MKRNTTKRAAENRAADKWRREQCESVGKCEYCGRKRTIDRLCVHELLKGPLRRLCMDKAYATLVVCQLHCHEAADRESKERQLARLYLNRAGDYDLAAFHVIRGRRLPEQEAVDSEIQLLIGDDVFGNWK